MFMFNRGVSSATTEPNSALEFPYQYSSEREPTTHSHYTTVDNTNRFFSGYSVGGGHSTYCTLLTLALLFQIPSYGTYLVLVIVFIMMKA